MILMTILYAARVARYDLFKPIQFLAKRISKWDCKCDARLHQLMCYVNDTVDFLGFGFIGDHPKDLTLHLYCDADFAGCPYSLKSTPVELTPKSKDPIVDLPGVQDPTSRLAERSLLLKLSWCP